MPEALGTNTPCSSLGCSQLKPMGCCLLRGLQEGISTSQLFSQDSGREGVTAFYCKNIHKIIILKNTTKPKTWLFTSSGHCLQGLRIYCIMSLKSGYTCLETALLRYLNEFNKAIMLTALAELWRHYRPHLLLKGTDGACTANCRMHQDYLRSSSCFGWMNRTGKSADQLVF